MAATLKDVSLESGVGITTVSKVLNGKEVRCGDDVRQRIIETAEKLSYRPNPLARSLVTRRSNSIMLIAQGLGLDFGAAEHECYENGFNLQIVATHHDKKKIEDMLIYARQTYIDGVLLMNPRTDSDVLQKAYSDNYPIVLLEEDSSIYPEMDMFGTDLEGAVAMAVSHLVSLGHKRIATILLDNDCSPSYLRVDSWRNSLLSHGITPKDDWLFLFEGQERSDTLSDFICRNNEAAKEFMRRYPKDDPKRPTAIMLMVDTFAAPVEQAFLSNGWRIPEDISIISTMSEAAGKYSHVPITSVDLDQNGARIRAMRFLVQKVCGEVESDVPSRNFAKPRLVVRKSTAQAAFK